MVFVSFMKLFGLAVVLLGLTGWSAFQFITAPHWSTSLSWWALTMVLLMNFWAVGVHFLLRYSLVALSGFALFQQFSHHITSLHLLFGLGALLITFLLCKSQYAAEALWSTKTIVIDWLVCTVLIVVCACWDVTQGTQHLVLALAYFCSSNILSVMVMKCAEGIMRWRSPTGSPRATYIHNLTIPRTVIPSLHTEELLTISWMLVFILIGKAEHFLSLPNTAVPKWTLLAATGLWGSLFSYMCPLIADKNPSTYYTPQELAMKRQQS